MRSDWLAKALMLKNELGADVSGGKMLKLERIAANLGISAQTAQHLLRAANFMNGLPEGDADLAAKLSSMPYQSIIAIERWYARDRDELLRFLQDNPTASVRQIIEAEKAARGAADRPPFYGDPAQHFMMVIAGCGRPLGPGAKLGALLGWSNLDLEDLSRLTWKRIAEGYPRSIGVDAAAAIGRDKQAGILVGPQSPTLGRYNRSARSIWSDAVCAASLFQLVFVLLPSREARDACLTSMPLPPTGREGWPDWNTVAPVRGKPRSGASRPATPHGGVLMFTTPEIAVEDWET